MREAGTPSIGELAELTPETRDRYVDFLRAWSILAVVVGHWFIAIVHVDHGLVSTTSAVGVTSGMWLATWFFQVMPIFFFVGGFSNLVAYESYRRRGSTTGAFVTSRVRRLLRPSVVFLGIWLVVQVGLHLADVGRPAGLELWGDTRMLRGMLPPAATLPFGPLWFLGAYLVVVAISPVTIALHGRFGAWVPAAMIAATIAVDVVGFGMDLDAVRYLNVAFVLLLPHQLGHAYADGSLGRRPRSVFWAMAAAGLGAMVLLTNPWIFRPFGAARFDWFPGIGHYPKSLLGTDVEVVSNAYPPTVCFTAAAIWAVGAAMLLRPALSRWLRERGPWKGVVAVNGVIMTLFLWHMTAYLLAILALWPLGFGREQDSTARWWLERPLWILAPGLVLAGLVAALARFERPRAAGVPAPPERAGDARP